MTVVTPTEPKIQCFFRGQYPSTRQTIDLGTDTPTRSTKVIVSAKFQRTGSSTTRSHTLGAEMWLATKSNFANKKVYRQTLSRSKEANVAKTATFALPKLAENTKYYVRFFSVEDGNKTNGSTTPSLTRSFWTNRTSAAPLIVTPPADIQHETGASIPFQITPSDPDDSGSTGAWGEDYVGFEVYYRRTSILGVPVDSQWRFWFGNVPSISQPDVCGSTDASQYANVGKTATSPAGVELNPGPYEIKVVSYQYIHLSVVRTLQNGRYLSSRKQRGGVSSATQNLFITGPSSVIGWPTNLTPLVEEAVEPNDDGQYDVLFSWDNPDPQTGSYDPCVLEFQWREVGDEDWSTMHRDAYTAHEMSSVDQGLFFLPYVNYEWRVRTSEQGCGTPGWSSWSIPTTFWTVPAPDSGPLIEPSDDGIPLPQLGCGINKAYIYDRGGKNERGKLTQTTLIRWERKRDDISSATIRVEGWNADCGALLANTRSWINELVIFREGPQGLERVWEGPITRIKYHPDYVEIEARDVMAYVYRRILRLGFNDAYPRLKSIVTRAKELIQNALIYDDPNVLQYLSPRETGDDANSSRVVKAWSNTVWGVVDDMAAKNGLDYTTVGRRILLWDTHNEIGRLPEMKDGDFNESPVVTEYGMQLANLYGVTNNTDIYGFAMRGFDGDDPLYYGFIEMLSSSYAESETGSSETLVGEARQDAIDKLSDQAERNINNRWPTPVVVAIPDNSTLQPELNVGINQLIPGVWIPLRANTTLRPVVQVQKLDYMRSESTGGADEKISVIMSPRPRSNDDSDADDTEEDV